MRRSELRSTFEFRDEEQTTAMARMRGAKAQSPVIQLDHVHLDGASLICGPGDCSIARAEALGARLHSVSVSRHTGTHSISSSHSIQQQSFFGAEGIRTHLTFHAYPGCKHTYT